ncbi:MAG TPA: LytR C-terminal domain-containing protein [Acidimicrobiia bacterium]|nr:LytR C-terminal domain-containing protein [Acidimicrobiia bacterium]
MTNKGKHSSQTQGTFYRDLAIMILGILLVGAIVFLLLWLWADQPETGPSSTTSTVGQTSTSGATVTSSTPTSQPAPTTAPPPDSTVAVRPPSEVTVVVLNSIGIDGAAGRLTTELAAAGYQTITGDNYEPEQDPSRIWYREGYAAEAAALVEFLPGATVEPLPDESLQEGANVILVLGTGYSE